MSGRNPDGDNLYGYVLMLGSLPEGVHSFESRAIVSGYSEDIAEIIFKWRAATPEANVEMSKLLCETLSKAGSKGYE